MIKQYAYRFRLYPTKEQQTFLSEQDGYIRFAYNFFLERSNRLYVLGVKDAYKQYSNNMILPKLKKGFPFLKNALSQALQASLGDLEAAYKNFFQGRAKYPKFKSKRDYNSISLPQGFKHTGDKLSIPKLKTDIKVKVNRYKRNGRVVITENIKSVSIAKTRTGKYYVNLLVEKEFIPLPKTDKVAGIDLGLKDYATLTTGTSNTDKVSYREANPKYLAKSQKRLVRLQRQLDRKQHRRGRNDNKCASKSYKKFTATVSKLHEHILNQRRDFLHKLSSRTVSDSQVIVLEDLNIKGMVKNRHLSKSISDAGWGMFREFALYKADWYGRDVHKVNRFYPSSKICSNCGHIKHDLKLSERSWVCPKCGTLHDRDENASNNLFLEGLKNVGRIRSRTITKPTALCPMKWPEPSVEISLATPAEYAPAGIQSTGYSRHTSKQEAAASLSGR